MTPERELEVLRAEMKRQIRQDGISLSDRTFREIGQRVQDINKSGDLKTPVTTAEVLEIYLRFFSELTSERTQMLQMKLVEARAESKPREISTSGGKPGGAFQV